MIIEVVLGKFHLLKKTWCRIADRGWGVHWCCPLVLSNLDAFDHLLEESIIQWLLCPAEDFEVFFCLDGRLDMPL